MYRNKLNSNVFDKYFNFTEYTNDFLEKTSLQIGGSESSDSDSISERNLSKVVVFYNDNTFDELQNKIL